MSESKVNHEGRLWLLGFVLLVVACGTYRPEHPSPVTLGARRGAVPPPGLCRIYSGGEVPRAPESARDCDGLQHSAPYGAQILYRPDDGSRTVVVCYLGTEPPRRIVGMDLFDIDNGRLVRVIQEYGEPAGSDDCHRAYVMKR